MDKIEKKLHLENLLNTLKLLEKQKRKSKEDWDRDIDILLKIFSDEYHKENGSLSTNIDNSYMSNLEKEKNYVMKFLEEEKRNPTKRKERFDKAIEEFIDDVEDKFRNL